MYYHAMSHMRVTWVPILQAPVVEKVTFLNQYPTRMQPVIVVAVVGVPSNIMHDGRRATARRGCPSCFTAHNILPYNIMDNRG